MIRKHIFTVRWEREGTRAFPEFERYVYCDWPETLPPNDTLPPTAVLLDLSKQEMEQKLADELPEDCRHALAILRGMQLRCRFSPETQGPYVLDDPHQLWDEELLLSWIGNATDRELDALHSKYRRC